MMTPDELRELCAKVRARNRTGGPPPGSPEVDEKMVGMIEADIREYRDTFLTDPKPGLPPAELLERLPLMGWLIYETSLDRLWVVATAFESLEGEHGAESREAAELIRRLADAARELDWPEFGPRALGAIRALALVESKRDNERGYDLAWSLHQEADERYESYLDTLGNGSDRDRYVVDLQEVLLQLALAETGTACRTAERVIGRWGWDKEFTFEDPDEDTRASERWTQRMFRELSEGVEIGERALATANKIKETHEFVHKVTEKRLTLATGLRNPAIMTCRAILLTYSMCPQMQRLRPTAPAPFETWAAFQKDLLRRFNIAFADLCARVQKVDGEDWPLNAEHARSRVQLCLHLALVTARHSLPEPVVVDDTLTLHVLDDTAVEQMSTWLVVKKDGKQRGDANTIGTSSKPDFNTSVEDCRQDPGAAADYEAWRIRWFELDRYAREPGRRALIARIFHVSEESIPEPPPLG
jgi:hypothetical protein